MGSLKDLPSNGKEGFVVRVSGDTAKGQDDYFVKLRTTDTGSDTVWKETVGPSSLKGLDATTLPHKLVREANGTFTFSPVDWVERKAGNDDTNPFPSFANYDETAYPAGQYSINDIFFYKNRLCLLSDENLICSASGDFFTFFNQTVLTVLDDAPIDVAVSNNAVSILKYAVPFNNSLILFSDLTQFRVTSVDIFSASTISVNVSTQFEASLNSRPAAAGKYVFFPTLRGIWSGVREYFVESDNDTNDAADITAHVPEYISDKGPVSHKHALSCDRKPVLSVRHHLAIVRDDKRAKHEAVNTGEHGYVQIGVCHGCGRGHGSNSLASAQQRCLPEDYVLLRARLLPSTASVRGVRDGARLEEMQCMQAGVFLQQDLHAGRLASTQA